MQIVDQSAGSFPLSSCAIITSAWKRLEENAPVNSTSTLPSPTSLPSFAQAFFGLSHILHESLSPKSTDLPHVESKLLLWPTALIPSLLYIHRSLSSPDSSILHVLHNALSTRYYVARLQRHELGLEPNHAVLSFLATLACSSVKVWKGNGKKFVHSWGNVFISAISSTMRHTKTIMQLFDCKLARGVLIMFLLSVSSTDVTLFGEALLAELTHALGLPAQQSLEEQQELLCSGAYGTTFEQVDSDGFIIYWMFRDMRSMMLSTIMSKSHNRNLSIAQDDQSHES